MEVILIFLMLPLLPFGFMLMIPDIPMWIVCRVMVLRCLFSIWCYHNVPGEETWADRAIYYASIALLVLTILLLFMTWGLDIRGAFAKFFG